MLSEATAFLAIWHNLEEKGKTEWERWHTCEHMPERVGIPGFLAGRRYMSNEEQKQSCFTIYEGTGLSVFKSAVYLEHLNNPTPWTKKNARTFKNFTRGACQRVAGAGFAQGYGGAIFTSQIVRGTTFMEKTEHSSLLEQLTSSVCRLPGVTGVTIGFCDKEITNSETAERRLRENTPESNLDGVVFVEGYNLHTIRKHGPEIEYMISDSKADLTPLPHQIYEFSYMLRK